MSNSRLLQRAQREPAAVKTWALAVLGDLVVAAGSPVAGITSPTVAPAAPVAAAILRLPEDGTTRPLFTSLSDWQELQATQARSMALAILGVIPREPQWVNYAEVVSALADAAGSMAEFENARQIQTQLLDAARETGQDLEDIGRDVERTVQDNIRPGAFAFGAGFVAALLAVLWLTS